MEVLGLSGLWWIGKAGAACHRRQWKEQCSSTKIITIVGGKKQGWLMEVSFMLLCCYHIMQWDPFAWVYAGYEKVFIMHGSQLFLTLKKEKEKEKILPQLND